MKDLAVDLDLDVLLEAVRVDTVHQVVAVVAFANVKPIVTANVSRDLRLCQLVVQRLQGGFQSVLKRQNKLSLTKSLPRSQWPIL